MLVLDEQYDKRLPEYESDPTDKSWVEKTAEIDRQMDELAAESDDIEELLESQCTARYQLTRRVVHSPQPCLIPPLCVCCVVVQTNSE
jgi:hypothetical protein